MRPFDTNRLREATRGPGADTRVWFALGRIEDGDEAIRLDEGLGMLVDVTILGGPLDDEGPVPCRLAQDFVEADGILSHPLDRSAVYVVSIPSGDLNEQPTIVGRLYAAETRPPMTVNGEEVTAGLLASAHVLRSSARAEVELDGDLRVRAANIRALGATVELGEEGAAASYVRGEDLRDAIEAFAEDVLAAAAKLDPGTPPAPVTQVQVAAFTLDLGLALATLKAAAPGYLSTRIRGE